MGRKCDVDRLYLHQTQGLDRGDDPVTLGVQRLRLCPCWHAICTVTSPRLKSRKVLWGCIDTCDSLEGYKSSAWAHDTIIVSYLFRLQGR